MEDLNPQAEEAQEEPTVEESAPSEEEAEHQEEAEASQEEPQEEDEESKVSPGVQQRINKLTRQKYEERRRVEELEKKLQQFEAQSNNVEAPKPPREEDYDWDDVAFKAAQEKYLQDMVDYRLEQKAQSIFKTQHEKEIEAKREQRNAEFAQKIQKSGLKDYGTVVGQLATVKELQPEIVDAIQGDENGPQIAYYLGNHLDIADRIANSSPVEAALELGRISAQMAKGKPVKTTKAPDPINPVKSGGGTVKKDWSKMTMEEIMNS